MPAIWDLLRRDYFIALLSRFPALNFATLVEGILISFPVCGFLPVLALLLATEKVPNPVRASLSPFFNALVTLLVNALTAFSADAFEILASFPMLAINSAFVIANHLLLLGKKFSVIEMASGCQKRCPS